jgi:hypothetical protein
MKSKNLYGGLISVQTIMYKFKDDPNRGDAMRNALETLDGCNSLYKDSIGILTNKDRNVCVTEREIRTNNGTELVLTQRITIKGHGEGTVIKITSVRDGNILVSEVLSREVSRNFLLLCSVYYLNLLIDPFIVDHCKNVLEKIGYDFNFDYLKSKLGEIMRTKVDFKVGKEIISLLNTIEMMNRTLIMIHLSGGNMRYRRNLFDKISNGRQLSMSFDSDKRYFFLNESDRDVSGFIENLDFSPMYNNEYGVNWIHSDGKDLVLDFSYGMGEARFKPLGYNPEYNIYVYVCEDIYLNGRRRLLSLSIGESGVIFYFNFPRFIIDKSEDRNSILRTGDLEIFGNKRDGYLIGKLKEKTGFIEYEATNPKMNFYVMESTEMDFGEYVNAFGNIMNVGGKYCDPEYLKDLHLEGIIPYMRSIFYVVTHGNEEEETVIEYNPSKLESKVIARDYVGGLFTSLLCGEYTGKESTRPPRPVLIGGYYSHINHPIFG